MLEAVFLGLVQGVTEFLPVSSSGHLVLAQHLLGVKSLDPAFDVFVQGGTVLSVLLYYNKRLIYLAQKYFLLVTLATIPAAVVGLLLSAKIDAIFSSLKGVSLGFFLTTIVVWFSKKASPTTNSVTLKGAQALKVGLAQVFAILPGLSRSGTTITTALILGVAPQDAFDLSFLMSVPIIAAASFLGARHLSWDHDLGVMYLVGFAVAAVSGYYALHYLAKILKKGQFYRFAPYTFALAIITAILAALPH